MDADSLSGRPLPFRDDPDRRDRAVWNGTDDLAMGQLGDDCFWFWLVNLCAFEKPYPSGSLMRTVSYQFGSVFTPVFERGSR